MEEKKVTQQGKPWDTDSSHETFIEAVVRQGELTTKWSENKIEGMQVKIKRRNSTGKFVVKTRLHPDFQPKKATKKTKTKRKSKKAEKK